MVSGSRRVMEFIPACAMMLKGPMLRFSPYFTFTPPFLHYDYLIPLLQGHMAIHAPPL